MSWLITGSQKVNWTPNAADYSLWLDADSNATLFDATSGGSAVTDNGAVARWESRATSANHVTQSTSGSRPIYKSTGFNGKKTVYFDGIDDFLQGTTLATFLDVDSFTLFLVGNAISANTDNSIAYNNEAFIGATLQNLSLFVRSSNLVGMSVYGIQDRSATTPYTAGASSWAVFTGEQSSGQVRIALNGSAYTSSTAENRVAAAENLLLGKTGSVASNLYTLECNISEVLFSKRAIGDFERRRIEGYLAHKWGLTTNLPNDHPFKVNPPAP